MAKHARLSPSASERWLNCPGSTTFKIVPGGAPSPYAEEGTAAHALLETCLRFGTEPKDHLDAIFHDRVPDDGMIEAVGHALDWIRAYVSKNGGDVYVEHRVDPGQFAFGTRVRRDDLFGTGDVFIDAYPEELVVLDYKHGAGVPVEAEENTQLLLYALGYRGESKKAFKTYRSVIVQPRARHASGPVREWVYDNAYLSGFADRVYEAALRTDRAQSGGAEFFSPGDHCRWCPGKAVCRALAEFSLTAACAEFSTPLDTSAPLSSQPLAPLTDAEFVYLLRNAEVIQGWLRSLFTEAEERLRRGEAVPGFKLVEGRATRVWSLPEPEVIALLRKTGLTLDQAAPRSVLSPAAAEKTVGAAKYRKALAPAVERRISNTFHVVPDTDPRPPVKIAADQFDDTVLD